MSVPLCSIRAGYNHGWRFVARLGEMTGLWQCDQCQKIEEGRAISFAESKTVPFIVESVEVPR